MSHPSLPPEVSRPWVLAVVVVWVLAVVLVPDRALPPLPRGQFETTGVLVSDVVPGRYGPWALAETDLGPVVLDLDDDPGLAMGDRVLIEGVADGAAGEIGGRPHRSWVAVRSLERLGPSPSPHQAVGNMIRYRVMDRLQPFDDGRALLAGFLIGDTSELDRSDIEAMRLSGLSHFVAVSGSNVALFLALLACAAGPLAWGPRRRAVLGLLGLPVYAAATRFEPSVLRASVMAGLALIGRLVGVVLEAWQLLSLAVIVLIAVDPQITASVGFQLSVAATAGVIAGARWPLNGGRVLRTIAVTCGAQLAVAPLLLLHFGSVPLLAPLTNLLAAPLVVFSTLLGAVAVVGFGFLTDLASWSAGLVLVIARSGSAWPQLGVWPLLGLVVGSGLTLRLPRLRPVSALAATVLTVVIVVGEGGRVPDPGVIVLDVGQGDGIVIHGGDGRFALVDGGPDPVTLLGRLRRYGVRSLDMVVLTHVHADHVTGLAGLIGELAIGEVWMATSPHTTPAFAEFGAVLGRSGIPVHIPRRGETRVLGGLQIRVEGPLRRYASPNDQSIVLTVTGARRSMLLTGDIEVIAQRELGRLRADILKVPHQGAATSDPDWLVGVGASVAVISVGPNTFGHPAGWVVDLLESTGATVIRTDLSGDIPLDL